MKTLTKIAVLLLAILMLVPCLAACGGNGDETTVTTGDGKTPGNDPNDTTAPTDGMPPVIDMSSNGNDYIYKAYVRSKEDGEKGNGGFYCEDFWVAESTEDALSFAVYSRNAKIQETYHCRIVQRDSTGSTYEEMRAFYSNQEKYDLAIMLDYDVAPAAISNLLQDVMSMEFVDLTHPAYDQNSIKQLSMGGKLYYFSGDMNISTLDNAAPTIVNMEMYQDYTEEFVDVFGDEMYGDIYELVTEHAWTMDTLLTMAEVVNVDQNKSDGALDIAKGDTMGYFQYASAPLYYFYGAGGRITEIDEDGYPEIVITSDANQEIYNYLFNNFNTNTSSWLPNGLSGPRGNNFYGGACLFTDMTLWDVRKNLYPKDAFEYGLLPNPLLEEDNSYNNIVFFQGAPHLWTIPSMCNNQEYAERMLQILAVYSSQKDSTMDAYYQKTMYMTVAQDKGSREVMDIIRTSLVYDIALLYDWGGYKEMILNSDTTVSNQFASYANKLETAEENMQLTLEQFKNPAFVPDAQ